MTLSEFDLFPSSNTVFVAYRRNSNNFCLAGVKPKCLSGRGNVLELVKGLLEWDGSRLIFTDDTVTIIPIL